MIADELADRLLDDEIKKQVALAINLGLLKPTQLSVEILSTLQEFLEEERKGLLEEIEE